MYIERQINNNNKILYGWGRYSYRYAGIHWIQGPYCREVKK